MVEAEPYSVARRWLTSGQDTVVGHEAGLLLLLCCWPAMAWPGINVNYFRV